MQHETSKAEQSHVEYRDRIVTKEVEVIVYRDREVPEVRLCAS